MEFRVTQEIFEKFPELCIGLVVAKGINNADTPQAVSELLKVETANVRQNLNMNIVHDMPKLVAWREAYSSFKAKPKKYKCSIENLYRMLLDGRSLGSINTVVDIYNALSLKYAMPFGGDDLDNVSEFIELRYAQGSERFIPLGSSDERNPKAGEIIYADSKEALCRRWNWRECDKSKMTDASTNVSLVVEGLAPATREEVEQAIAELSELVSTHCGGSCDSYIIDANNPAVKF